MEVRHEPADAEAAHTLAMDVELADSFGTQLKGLMFREELPADFAMVFDFGRPGFRSIHMLFVRVSLDVLWLREDEVVQRKTLAPWRGAGMARADRVIELPAGAADGVEAGDRVVLADEPED